MQSESSDQHLDQEHTYMRTAQELTNKIVTSVSSAKRGREEAEDAIRELQRIRDTIDKQIADAVDVLDQTFGKGSGRNALIAPTAPPAHTPKAGASPRVPEDASRNGKNGPVLERVLAALKARGALAFTTLSEEFKVTPAAIHYHVKQHPDLFKTRRDGKRLMVALKAKAR